ncbi:MAG: ABC transporter permease [Eubacteriales bacterium]
MKDRRMFAFELVRGAAAILVALGVGTIFIFLSSDEPFTALRYLLIGPLISLKDGMASFNTQGLYTILAAMIPTIFTGLAVCVMFSSNQFNLAGEGVVMTGGFVAALAGIYIHMNSGLHAVVCVLIAAVLGGIIMLVPALLKVKLGASEMVTSLMLNYVAMYTVLHFLNYSFADRSKGSTQTFPFAETAKIGSLVPGGSKLSWGFVIAIVFVAIIALFMYRTRWGYAIRMIGVNQAFSKYSGMKVGGTIVLAQVIGGVLAGMGGSIEVLGRYSTFLWKELPGYGWTGVTIAILAKNNPLLVPLAAFFIAYLNKGCQLMVTYCDVPSEMIDIIQAAIFLFFAAEVFLAGYRQKIVGHEHCADLAKSCGGCRRGC